MFLSTFPPSLLSQANKVHTQTKSKYSQTENGIEIIKFGNGDYRSRGSKKGKGVGEAGVCLGKIEVKLEEH